jgi:hypothetical protein
MTIDNYRQKGLNTRVVWSDVIVRRLCDRSGVYTLSGEAADITKEEKSFV